MINSMGNNNLSGAVTNVQLESLYNDILKLRNSTPAAAVPYRTVFNDIADEWSNCSEEEKHFIEVDEDYATANLVYQQQFNAFLLEVMGVQFLNSQYGKSAESVLVALKKAKGKYKKVASDNVATVRAENAELQRQLKELKQMLGVEDGGAAHE